MTPQVSEDHGNVPGDEHHSTEGIKQTEPLASASNEPEQHTMPEEPKPFEKTGDSTDIGQSESSVPNESPADKDQDAASEGSEPRL